MFEVLIGLIAIFGFSYYVGKKDKRERQERKRKAREDHESYVRMEARHRKEKHNAEMAEIRRKAKKEAIRKQKEDSDREILKAKSERRMREKLKPIQEESISKQKNAMEEIDQEVVINWHKAVINKCQNYEKNHSNFLADYEDSKNSIDFLDSLHFELDLNLQPDSMLFDDKEYEWENVSNVELYLVKLKTSLL